MTLVDFHRSSVWVLDDDPATPRHLLMPTQERCPGASQLGSDRIQGINEETEERAPTLTDCGRPTRGLRRVDRDMYAANLGSEVHRALSVVLILQSDAGRSVKVRGLLGLRFKQHQGSDLEHALNPATIDFAHPSPLRAKSHATTGAPAVNPAPERIGATPSRPPSSKLLSVPGWSPLGGAPALASRRPPVLRPSCPPSGRPSLFPLPLCHHETTRRQGGPAGAGRNPCAARRAGPTGAGAHDAGAGGRGACPLTETLTHTDTKAATRFRDARSRSRVRAAFS